jgi:hypothetical protein
MAQKGNSLWLGLIMAFTLAPHASAEWTFNSIAGPNASIRTDKMSLEFQCDRIRFAPAGFEDSQDIVKKRGLSFRFLKNGSTEVGSFQAGDANSSIQIVDNYPVEIVFNDANDYLFIQEQIAKNKVLNLSMVDQDVTYGIFDLKGSTAVFNSLKTACNSSVLENHLMAIPEGVVYCGGGGIKRQIEYVILENVADQWNARVTVNGETHKAMTSYSYFGKGKPPRGFVVALLGEKQGSGEFLIFRDGNKNWLEYGDYEYKQCN